MNLELNVLLLTVLLQNFKASIALFYYAKYINIDGGLMVKSYGTCFTYSVSFVKSGACTCSALRHQVPKIMNYFLQN